MGYIGVITHLFVDLALNQAAKPWFHQYLNPAEGTICGGLCSKMFFGDNSATSLFHIICPVKRNGTPPCRSTSADGRTEHSRINGVTVMDRGFGSQN